MAGGKKKKKRQPGGDEQVGWGLHASFSTRPRTLETTARTQRSWNSHMVSRHFDRATNAFYQRPHTSGPAGTDRGNTTRRQSAKPLPKMLHINSPPFPSGPPHTDVASDKLQ